MGQAAQHDILVNLKKHLKWIVLGLAFLLYANTLNHGWALDDFSVIVNHTHVQSGVDGLSAIFTTNYRHGNAGFNDGLYRPLSLVMFALEKEFFNSSTTIAHLINVLLYAFGCFFLFASLQQIFKHKSLLVPFGICLLFLAHPIHTEVVANIKSRDEILAFFGFSLSLLFALKAIDSSSKKHFALSALGFLVALFSKESAVLFCAIIPLTILLKQNVTPKSLGKLLLLYIPLTVLFLLIRAYVLQNLENPIDPGNFGLLNNPIAAETDASLKWGSTFYLQVLFLVKLLLPHSLIHDYSFSQIPLNTIFSWQSILGLITLVEISATAVWGIITKNRFGITVAIYGASILIASQIITPIGVQFAERLLFISVLPFSIAVVLLLEKLISKKNYFSNKKQKAALTLILLVGSLYAFKTISRNADWKNNLTLYSADIGSGSNSARINYNYGTELNLAAQQSKNQKIKREYCLQSIVYLKQAISIYPEYLDAYNNLGLAYKNLGDYASSIKTFRQGIQQKSDYAKFHFNLGTVYLENKQYREAKKTFANYTNLNLNSDQAYFFMAQASGFLNEMKDAITFLNRSIALNSSNSDAYNLLGMAYGMTNQPIKAVAAFEQSVQLDSRNISKLLNLALACRNTNQKSKERTTLQSILQIDPNNSVARNQLNSQ